jgi:hypothetical protein
MRVAAAVLWFALLLVLPVAGRAATISGHVRERNSGEVLPGAHVTLCGPASSKCRTTTADAHGFYRFIGVPTSESYVLTPDLGGWSLPTKPIGYVFQDDRVDADVYLVMGIYCGITVGPDIPQILSPPGTFRVRAAAMDALP